MSALNLWEGASISALNLWQGALMSVLIHGKLKAAMFFSQLFVSSAKS